MKAKIAAGLLLMLLCVIRAIGQFPTAPKSNAFRDSLAPTSVLLRRPFDEAMTEAHVAFRMTDFDRAIDACDAALKMKPLGSRASFALSERAKAYATKGDWAKAFRDSKEAVADDPRNQDTAILVTLAVLNLL